MTTPVWLLGTPLIGNANRTVDTLHPLWTVEIWACLKIGHSKSNG